MSLMKDSCIKDAPGTDQVNPGRGGSSRLAGRPRNACVRTRPGSLRSAGAPDPRSGLRGANRLGGNSCYNLAPQHVRLRAGTSGRQLLNDAKVTLLRPDITTGSLPPDVAVSQVAEHLRETIIGGWLRRGQTLLVREVADGIGASAGIVREAFAQLSAEFYLRRRGRSTIVAPFCVEAYALLERRLPLETRLTRLATRRMTPFGLRLLQQIRQEMVEAQHRQDLAAVQRGNYRFHRVLYSFADRPDLLAEVRSLWAVFPFDLMTTMPGRMTEMAAEHSTVLTMLHTGDPRKAGRAMHYHILHGWQAFRRNYKLPPAERQPRRAGPH
jgi:DNA-binding GntR family transcriptional regulator